MQHKYGLQDVHIQKSWLAIGSFDGVHLGHQEIIRQITAGAHAVGAPAVVLTFYPHPSVVLRGVSQSFYLTLPHEKADLLGALGVDLVITHPFDREVAEIPPQVFIDTLQTHLGIEQLWVGYDFALGKDRAGDVPALKKMGAEIGFKVQEVQAYKLDGETVSSSRIRRLLENGEIEETNRRLGRTYTLPGSIIHGEGRGRRLGIPTANLGVDENRAVPGAGVYACRVAWQGRTYPAVTNVGVRPTFETEPVAPRVETHILDFSENLYNQEIHVSFISRLRAERRFDGPEALVAQIRKDIQAAREQLSALSETHGIE